MKIEDHLKNLKESIDVIEESIQKGLKERQRNIGFNTSAASADMLEVFLHKKKFIDPGALIKHEWFSSERKIKEKFSFDFENKKEILGLMKAIEEKRNLLCYGKPRPEKVIENVVLNFLKLKEIFEKLGIKTKNG